MDLYEFSHGDLKICQMHIDAFQDKFQEEGRRGVSNIDLHGSSSPISDKISAKLVAYLKLCKKNEDSREEKRAIVRIRDVTTAEQEEYCRKVLEEAPAADDPGEYIQNLMENLFDSLVVTE